MLVLLHLRAESMRVIPAGFNARTLTPAPLPKERGFSGREWCNRSSHRVKYGRECGVKAGVEVVGALVGGGRFGMGLGAVADEGAAADGLFQVRKASRAAACQQCGAEDGGVGRVQTPPQAGW